MVDATIWVSCCSAPAKLATSFSCNGVFDCSSFSFSAPALPWPRPSDPPCPPPAHPHAHLHAQSYNDDSSDSSLDRWVEGVLEKEEAGAKGKSEAPTEGRDSSSQDDDAEGQVDANEKEQFFASCGQGRRDQPAAFRALVYMVKMWTVRTGGRPPVGSYGGPKGGQHKFMPWIKRAYLVEAAWAITQLRAEEGIQGVSEEDLLGVKGLGPVTIEHFGPAIAEVASHNRVLTKCLCGAPAVRRRQHAEGWVLGCIKELPHKEQGTPCAYAAACGPPAKAQKKRRKAKPPAKSEACPKQRPLFTSLWTREAHYALKEAYERLSTAGGQYWRAVAEQVSAVTSRRYTSKQCKSRVQKAANTAKYGAHSIDGPAEAVQKKREKVDPPPYRARAAKRNARWGPASDGVMATARASRRRVTVQGHGDCQPPTAGRPTPARPA